MKVPHEPHLTRVIDSAIHDGLRFLSRAQLPSGEMPVCAFNEPTLAGTGTLDSCIFATTFYLHAVAQLRRAQIAVPHAPFARAQRFVLREMIGPGLFAYYPRAHPIQLPPDTDDTCCASAVLRDAHPFLMWGENVSSLLRSRDSTGTFLTWIEPFAGPNQVDVGINANVLFYLGDRPETHLASAYLCRVFGKDDPVEHTSYYPDLLVLAYLAWRAYSAGARSLLDAVTASIHRMRPVQWTDASFGDDVRTACAIAVLSEQPIEPDSVRAAVEFLLARQQDNGSWHRGTMYRSAVAYFGSEALTTALCLDALTAARRMLLGADRRHTTATGSP
jgi:hypothetical protein